MGIRDSFKMLGGAAAVVWACSAGTATTRPGSGGPVAMNTAGDGAGVTGSSGMVGASGMTGVGGDASSSAGTTGTSGNGMIMGMAGVMGMVPDASAQTPPPTLSTTYQTVTTSCTVQTEYTVAGQAATTHYYVMYAQADFPGKSANELSGVRVVATYSQSYVTAYANYLNYFAANGYQAASSAAAVKDGSVLVWCGQKTDANGTITDQTTYSSVTVVLPVLSLG